MFNLLFPIFLPFKEWFLKRGLEIKQDLSRSLEEGLVLGHVLHLILHNRLLVLKDLQLFGHHPIHKFQIGS